MNEQVGEITSHSGLTGQSTRACVVRDLHHGYGAALVIVGAAHLHERSQFIDGTALAKKRHD